MAITDLIFSRHITVAAAIARLPSPATVALCVVHGAALLAIYLTEHGRFGLSVALLAWGLLNFLWLIVLRRAILAAVLSLAIVAAIILLSRFKFGILEMTLSFLDMLIVDADTVDVASKVTATP